MINIKEYPLYWPQGLVRTTARVDSKLKTSLITAINNVKNSLTLFSKDSKITVKDIIISSNVTLGTTKPPDAGVAVWFVWDNIQVCIAVDRYNKVEDNLQAIHHIIEARRVELRHGGLHIIRQTFKGFKGIPPAGGTSASSCWDTLGIKPTKKESDVQAAYRGKANDLHPEKGGNAEALAQLSDARDEAIKLIRSNNI